MQLSDSLCLACINCESDVIKLFAEMKVSSSTFSHMHEKIPRLEKGLPEMYGDLGRETNYIKEHAIIELERCCGRHSHLNSDQSTLT
jgi:hypothetical protein